MGPNNIALVTYFRADQRLREAQGRLMAATKDVRIQERKVADLSERQRLAAQKLKEQQSGAAQLELDLKSRDEQIEKLREQQTQSRNNREYQAFLVEINTAKADRGTVEDETIKALEAVERLSVELKDLSEQLKAEQARLQELKGLVSGKLDELQADIDARQAERDAAGAQVPTKMRDVFDRLADKYDGEAMAALAKPDRRREEYICTVCNMDQAVDTYNKLHSRDELLFCPSCRRVLYIPDDLPPEVAIKAKPKPRVVKETGKEAGKDAGKGAAKDVSNETPSERVTAGAGADSSADAVGARPASPGNV
jgi:predicted  nucleic acid-binding Zn-ribbon protein